MTELKQEIEYLKTLAEGGDKRSVPLAPYVTVFSAALALLTLAFRNSSLIDLIEKFGTNIKRPSLYLVMLIAPSIIITSIFAVFAFFTFRNKEKNFSSSSRTYNAIWIGLCFAMVDYLMVQIFFALSPDPLPLFKEWSEYLRPSIDLYHRAALLSLYSVSMPDMLILISFAWWVFASNSDSKFLIYLSISGFALAPSLGYFIKFLENYPIFEIIIVLYIIVPNLVLFWKTKN